MTAKRDRRIAIVGGGFAGSLLALRLAGKAGPAPILIEARPKAGPGLAYGAAEPNHALNVTVERMDVGLTPAFHDWLGAYPLETAEAVGEAGALAQAYVPRWLFGRYMAERVEAAVEAGHVSRVVGEVTGIRKGTTSYALTLADGRRIEAEEVVLATGHLPPRPPAVMSSDGGELKGAKAFIADPWAPGALQTIRDDAPILLIGSGLTAVDVVLALQARGYGNTIHLLSRKGLLPRVHLTGGTWPSFTAGAIGRSPVHILQLFRAELAAARWRGIPWQRVVDAMRPDIARIWSAWDEKARGRFLRHGRTLWDVHRHRMPPRIANRLIGLMDSRRLCCHAGRLASFEANGQVGLVSIGLRRSRDLRQIQVGHVINCTGPAGNYAEVDLPLFRDLRRQDLIKADALHLGITTHDTRVVDAGGNEVPGLYALGSLTRPAWWEITAVPDIAVQVSRLAAHWLEPDPADRPARAGAVAGLES